MSTAPHPAQGEVWWAETPERKGRPYLVLTRDAAIPVLRTVLVAPVTRTIRMIPSEVPLGPAHGLPVECVATLDNATTIDRTLLVRRMGELRHGERHLLCSAVRATVDC